jgi:hypothetical protein
MSGGTLNAKINTMKGLKMADHKEYLLIKVKAFTPKAIYRRVFQAIENLEQQYNFQCSVETSVDLNAKNTKNFKNKDLATLQIIQIAKNFNIKVEIEL